MISFLQCIIFELISYSEFILKTEILHFLSLKSAVYTQERLLIMGYSGARMICILLQMGTSISGAQHFLAFFPTYVLFCPTWKERYLLYAHHYKPQLVHIFFTPLFTAVYNAE